MHEERTGKCLRQVEHNRGHLWHIYFIAVNQVMVATVNFRNDDFNLTKRNPWFSSFLILLKVALNSITPTLTLTTIHRFTASDCFVMQLVHITTTVVMSISIYWEGEFVFNFPIVHFPFICSNIPAAETHRPAASHWQLFHIMLYREL
jgi:hypothetical protein